MRLMTSDDDIHNHHHHNEVDDYADDYQDEKAVMHLFAKRWWILGRSFIWNIEYIWNIFWIMSGIYPQCNWNISRIFLEDIWNIFGKYLENIWKVGSTRQEFNPTYWRALTMAWLPLSYSLPIELPPLDHPPPSSPLKTDLNSLPSCRALLICSWRLELLFFSPNWRVPGKISSRRLKIPTKTAANF